MRKVFRILSIDGGGVRGVIPATFLIEIEQRTGRYIHELFDLIAGTSTGGILALGLTTPGDEPGQPRYRADAGHRLYREEGPRIFARTAGRSLATLNGLLAPRYPTQPIETALRTYFGDQRLRHTLTDVVITSYDIEKRAPWFFRSLNARIRKGYDFSLVQVARSTAAGPGTFAPSRIVTDDDTVYNLVDGGVFANNPTMVAYVDMLSYYSGYDAVTVVSLGTGRVRRSIPFSRAQRWGLLGWAFPAIDILKSGANESVDYQMSQVLDSSRYFRFQIDLSAGEDNLDNATPANHDNLIDKARRSIQTGGPLQAHFDQLCAGLMTGAL